jgi:hypothetical protein
MVSKISSEISVKFYRATQHHLPEDSNTHRSENYKSNEKLDIFWIKYYFHLQSKKVSQAINQ